MAANLKSWVEIPQDSDFTLYNLPFGIFETDQIGARPGVALGDRVINLSAVARLGFFDNLNISYEVFEQSTLNGFIAQGKPVWSGVRNMLQELFAEGDDRLQKHADEVLLPMRNCRMKMPVQVGDYTDFYSSEEHATNVGKMFRGADNALMPNWKHLPVAYHGRSSSIVVSGTDIYRPKGQKMPPNAEKPVFGASSRMDFELEMAFVVGKDTALGDTIGTARAEDHIFGIVIFNDWSARDIQKWEYQPLGPFLGKNFGSSISPWIVTLQALEPFRTAGPKQNPEVLPYLQYQGDKSFDIQLEVLLQPEGGEESRVCRSNFRYLYWNMAQQLAHHTVNGCNVRVGDMLASGTISGPTEDSFGSMLELCRGGKKTVKLASGEERTFLLDNDTVIMRAFCEKDRLRVGFGEVRSKLLPARE